MKEKSVTLFSADLRSLALLRIGTALFLLITLLTTVPFLDVFYTDNGVLPRNFVEYVSHPYSWSIHFLGGSLLLQIILLLISVISCISLLFGYKTKIFTIISFVLLISLQNRNSMILDGGDYILKMLLFWGIFIPWGARISVDWLKSKTVRKMPDQFINIGVLGYFFQICMIYIFTSILKSGEEWNRDFTAIYYALSFDLYSNWIGHRLLNFPTILFGMTVFIKWYELIGTLLFFSPYKTSVIRMIAIIIYIGMHIGIALTMNIGLFPIISIIAFLGLIPSLFWEVINRRFEKYIKKINQTFKPWMKKENVKLWDISRVVNIAAVLALIYIFLWNSQTVTGGNFGKIFDSSGYITGVYQNWSLFAPSPIKNDFWYVVIGENGNGTRVNLLRPNDQISFVMPDNYAYYYPDRWKNFILSISRSRYHENEKLLLADYFCRESKNRGSPINRVEIYRVDKVNSLSIGSSNQSTIKKYVDYSCDTNLNFE